ncbi:hypothetical protein PVA45_08140 (plasmid) [Entomospira entomophila]|uniref:Uncharacterized protein n=1 Tax=Entomospira entomophila TaxID=2719988 RepID=A0A968KX45_9SPIO|nr:hypothetical protein [Entomospira entomophilus]NIZ41475.1 hypothetical protein [Entomospira entomophilus]WDI36309.1 hypothetical protein PVA45_08140 [Entomospira entomophilus]
MSSPVSSREKMIAILRYTTLFLWYSILLSILCVMLYAIAEGVLIYSKGSDYFPTRFLLRDFLQLLPLPFPLQGMQSRTIYQIQLPLSILGLALLSLMLVQSWHSYRKLQRLQQEIAKLKRAQSAIESTTLQGLLRKWSQDQQESLEQTLKSYDQIHSEQMQALKAQHDQWIERWHHGHQSNKDHMRQWQESQQRSLRLILKEWLQMMQDQSAKQNDAEVQSAPKAKLQPKTLQEKPSKIASNEEKKSPMPLVMTQPPMTEEAK